MQHPRIAPILLVMVATIVVDGLSTPVSAGWLIYHKPAYEGRIIDAETGEPIEGAIFVAEYEKEFFGLMGGGYRDIHIVEALTDKDGLFKIPSYTTVTGPLSWEGDVDFIIYKSGYAALLGQENIESAFTNRMPHETEHYWHARRDIVIRLSPGQISLPKLHDKELRKSNIHRIPIPKVFRGPEAIILRKMTSDEINQLYGAGS